MPRLFPALVAQWEEKYLREAERERQLLSGFVLLRSRPRSRQTPHPERFGDGREWTCHREEMTIKKREHARQSGGKGNEKAKHI